MTSAWRWLKAPGRLISSRYIAFWACEVDIMPKLESHIGRKVEFRPPVSAQKRGAENNKKVGKIVDEVWADEAQRDPPIHDHDDPECWGDYAFCSQLIEWEEGGFSIRLAYYHLPCKGDRWQFASQMTVETKSSIIKLLLERTLAKTDWFTKPEVRRF